MKRLAAKYYLNYAVLFVMFCVLGIVRLINALKHPRPHNVLLCLVDGFFCLLVYRYMQKTKFTPSYEYEKEVNKWKKQKRIAARKGEIFERKIPERPQHLAPHILAVFAAYLCAVCMTYGVSGIADVLYPYHMLYEYEDDIAELKRSAPDNYFFFPDTIPREAKNVKWIMQPSVMQGRGMEVLMFDTTKEYMDGIIETYGENAVVCDVEEDMCFKAYYKKEGLKVYKLYDNEDWNHVHMWGFFVDEEKNRIGFFNG